jgi:uncharacterized membrane protein
MKKNNTPPKILAHRIFRDEWAHLLEHERQAIESALQRISLPENLNQTISEKSTFGQRAADAIAAFGGSWRFIILFALVLIIWAVLNTEILGPRNAAFDPYPYVFLNLILSMLAALQAPVIMMSQNRQSEHDRLEAELDHQTNVRAELTIRDIDERLSSIQERLDIGDRMSQIEQQLNTLMQYLAAQSAEKRHSTLP